MSDSLLQSWRCLTGFTTDKERSCDSIARRPYLKKLYQLVDIRLRDAWLAHHGGQLDEEITVHWTPILGVCSDLQIPVGALNRYLKEFCGLTAQMMYDRIHCQKFELDQKVEGEVVRFIRAHFTPGHGGDFADELDLKEQELKFWRAWREHRKTTIGWSNASWAAQYGFSSYTRFHRAFTLAYGRSPIEHEAKTMKEAALYFRAGHSLYRRSRQEKFNREATDSNDEPRPNYPTYDGSFDHYVQLRSENPNWWSKQRERYGLYDFLHDLAKEVNDTEAQFKDDRLNANSRDLCTRETKIAAANTNPPTPRWNPWPK